MNEEDVKRIALGVMNTQGSVFSTAKVPQHVHNGVDSQPIDFSNIIEKQFTVTSHVVGTSAATAGNYGIFFIAPFKCSIVQMIENHGQAGTAGGTVIVAVRVISDGTAFNAANSATARTVIAFNLKTTANNNQESDLLPSRHPAVLVKGDRLALATSGTLTTVADVTVTVLMQII